ncbi:MAG TPA: phenylalanine--tRNA ligase subunit alpha, partial [Tianweitania sediminis]|nr:phenylalanine--tRNA ligase subunit alpha [Tianweitania sediminis]
MDVLTNDLQTLEAGVMAEIASASDEASLEAVRVGALGKKGTISEKLKTLGGMS